MTNHTASPQPYNPSNNFILIRLVYTFINLLKEPFIDLLFIIYYDLHATFYHTASNTDFHSRSYPIIRND